MSAEQTVARFRECRASAILRTPYAAAVRPAMQAAVEGGFRFVEFTLNTPGALEAIAAFAADDRLVVGAGTVMSAEQVDQAVDAGARFIVSPIVDEPVVEQRAAHLEAAEIVVSLGRLVEVGRRLVLRGGV